MNAANDPPDEHERLDERPAVAPDVTEEELSPRIDNIVPSCGYELTPMVGGLTIAQDPDEAEYDGMPRAAIASGMVDWVLEAGEMPKRLLDCILRESTLSLPPEEGPPPAVAKASISAWRTAGSSSARAAT